MSTLTPVGQIRYNANTLMSEVWDGKQWIEMDDSLNGFTPISIHSNNVYGGGITSANNITTTIGSNGTSARLTDNAREELYQFLKSNLRVGEYLDENGKIDYVQLELREGEGCIWETIQRVRIKQ
jgi:hypothetical protein